MIKLIITLSFLILTAKISFAENFRVGLSLCLTGPGQEFGEAGRNGALMAIEDYPDLFKDITFIYEDNKYDAKTGLTVYRKLKDIDKVDLIYNWGESPSLPVVPLAEKTGLPMIVLATMPELTKNKDYILSFYNSAAQYSLKILEYLRKAKKRDLAMFITQDPYSYQLLKGLQDNLKKDEKLDLLGEFQSSEMDFRTSLLKLRKSSFDIVGTIMFPGQLSKFYLQAAELGLNFDSFGFDVLASETEIKAAQGYLEGAVIAYHTVSDKFRKHYIEKYKNDVYLVYACNTYEFIKLTGELFQNSAHKQLSGKEIIQKYSNIAPRESCLGRYNFMKSAEYGNIFNFPIQLMKIKNDKIVLMEK